MRHPNVPESLDGWSILHRMYRFDRRAFDREPAARRDEIAREAIAILGPIGASDETDIGMAQILGAKADLMVTAYAKSFESLGEIEMAFDKLALRDYLEPLGSYVSILEIGMYDATGKIHAELRDRGLAPNTADWNTAFDELLAAQARNPHVAARLWAKIPQRRFVCFYPMDKKRGEAVNWYMLPYAERNALMHEHGKIGRTYHGQVTQVISGSVGFDDWEWGVDLYADDPMVFKKLVYEMRFDEASAKYGAFGQFVTGMQFALTELPHFLSGDRAPALRAVEPELALG